MSAIVVQRQRAESARAEIAGSTAAGLTVVAMKAIVSGRLRGHTIVADALAPLDHIEQSPAAARRSVLSAR